MLTGTQPTKLAHYQALDKATLDDVHCVVRAYRVTAHPIGMSAHFETIVYGTTRARADEAANKWLSGGDMDKVLKTVIMEEV